MEKLVEDLIIRLENQKSKDKEVAEKINPNSENQLGFICLGRVFAFDYCIGELKRLLCYYNDNTNGERNGAHTI